MQNYCISEIFKNAYSLCLTKITWKEARLIRRPCYMRGRNSIVGGKGLTTGYSCRFDLSGTENTLEIGENCEFGDNTHIVALHEVKIGKNVLLASKVFISDTNHGIYKGLRQDSPFTRPNDRKLTYNPVYIGDNVWVGENVVILAGSQIGDGCIIGANSVISGKIPSNSIVVGCNKIIKKYDLNESKWKKITE